MRYFRDSQRSLDFSPIAGCAHPLQYNFAIEDRDQPGKEAMIMHTERLDV